MHVKKIGCLTSKWIPESFRILDEFQFTILNKIHREHYFRCCKQNEPHIEFVVMSSTIHTKITYIEIREKFKHFLRCCIKIFQKKKKNLFASCICVTYIECILGTIFECVGSVAKCFHWRRLQKNSTWTNTYRIRKKTDTKEIWL